jgi:hypothetical protein
MTPRDTRDRASSPERGSHGASQTSHITPGHVRAYQAVTSQLYDNIALWSCWIDGEPGVAIVMVDHVGEGKVAVMPLFVAITEAMQVSFDSEAGGSGGGGGPRRSTVLREFEANLAALAPGGGK